MFSKIIKLSGIFIVIIGFIIVLPYLFLNLALRAKTNSNAGFYYTLAAKSAILPQTKATVYAEISSMFNIPNKELSLAIKNCEIAQKYSKHPACLLFNLYMLNGDYDKALIALKKEIKSSSQIEAQIYFLKGDINKAIDILNKKISKNPDSFDYAYLANIYDYIGEKNMAEKNYDMAYKTKKPNCPDEQIKQMQKNKNYIFDKIQKEREYFKINLQSK